EIRIALRAGRLYALSGDERADAFSRGLPPTAHAASSGVGGRTMCFVNEIDYGTPATQSSKTVTLTIDGTDIAVPEGTSIMRAARMAGIEVPKLCANDMVKAFGSCRLCLVEI